MLWLSSCQQSTSVLLHTDSANTAQAACSNNRIHKPAARTISKATDLVVAHEIHANDDNAATLDENVPAALFVHLLACAR
jgi:hypothetical protein